MMQARSLRGRNISYRGRHPTSNPILAGLPSAAFSARFRHLAPLNSSNEKKNRHKMELLSLEIFYGAAFVRADF